MPVWAQINVPWVSRGETDELSSCEAVVLCWLGLVLALLVCLSSLHASTRAQHHSCMSVAERVTASSSVSVLCACCKRGVKCAGLSLFLCMCACVQGEGGERCDCTGLAGCQPGVKSWFLFSQRC